MPALQVSQRNHSYWASDGEERKRGNISTAATVLEEAISLS
jgi:hypothetical protein